MKSVGNGGITGGSLSGTLPERSVRTGTICIFYSVNRTWHDTCWESGGRLRAGAVGNRCLANCGGWDMEMELCVLSGSSNPGLIKSSV